MDSDRIIVLDKGMIAEFDTVDALLSNKDSIFHGMARDAGIFSNTTADMTIEEAIDEAFRIDENDEISNSNGTDLNTKL